MNHIYRVLIEQEDKNKEIVQKTQMLDAIKFVERYVKEQRMKPVRRLQMNQKLNRCRVTLLESDDSFIIEKTRI